MRSYRQLVVIMEMLRSMVFLRFREEVWSRELAMSGLSLAEVSQKYWVMLVWLKRHRRSIPRSYVGLALTLNVPKPIFSKAVVFGPATTISVKELTERLC